jgi:peptide/nickel transport system substrate-binding protein
VRLAAVLCGLTLTAAACGGDDDDDADSTAPAGSVSGGTEPADVAETEETQASQESVAETDATEGTTAGEGTTEDAPEDTQGSLSNAPTDEGEPVYGGTLVYGVEADTANPWPGYRASMAPAGYVVISSVTDPLFLPNDDAETVPHLVETAEANADYTEWTFTLREGITFHDGTPFDAEAVKVNIDACRAAPLSRAGYSPIADVQADGQVVTITTTGPWVSLPAYFATNHACSYMLSGEWLKTLSDLPQRDPASPVYDEAIAATPASGDPSQPVGLGAFKFESYAPGNGNSFVAVRNDDYWRGDGPNSTGEGLPYLDRIEIVVAVDIQSRSSALRSGQFNIMHTSNLDEIAQFIDDDSFESHVSDKFGETGYLMLNVAEGDNPTLGQPLDPAGANADSPLLQLACRKALALAIDYERFNEERNAGLATIANGPFPQGSIGYLEDTGYPTFDPEAAQTEFDQCLADAGVDKLTLSFNTTNDPFNVESNSLILSMWQEAFGDAIDATIVPIEQGQYIGLALAGDFEVFPWRSHSGSDPDQQRRWWSSGTAQPIGTVGTNFGRFVDEVIDENLDIIRTNPDPDARREAAEAINRRFGEQVYDIWLNWALWGVITSPQVNGVEHNVLPGGGEGPGVYFGGRHSIPQIWCDDGDCS